MNAEDMPGPPAILPPMTVAQMGNNILQHFIQGVGIEETEAMGRAQLALGKLIAEGYVTEWGVDENGEMLWVPSSPTRRTVPIVAVIW